MRSRRLLPRALAVALSLSLAGSPARALVNLDYGHDHIYVTGSAGFGWDSNLFANRSAKADTSTTTTIVTEYTRRAGWIGVNASAALRSARYGTYTQENYNNPSFSAELTKQTGRTTGALTLSAARESRADAAVNVRSTSWNYAAGLNYRYPIGIYTLTGQFGYADVRYVGDLVFPSLATYTASANLVRTLSSQRDLMFGYRYRRSDTSVHSRYDDHSFTVGLDGRLIRGLNGTISAGYQFRIPHGFATDGTPERRFNAWTANAAATYAFNRRLNVTGRLSKDFSTTANDISVDTTTAGLDGQYAFTARWTMQGGVSTGDSRFLGPLGRVVPGGPARHDTFGDASLTLNYELNAHLKVAATVMWLRNWSNADYADFSRKTYNLNVSSRW